MHTTMQVEDGGKRTLDVSFYVGFVDLGGGYFQNFWINDPFANPLGLGVLIDQRNGL